MRVSQSTTTKVTDKRPATLGRHLDKRLLGYMATAGAAGVTVLAMTQPATAEVVYTPADRTLTWRGSNSLLDLNNDGIPDFGFTVSGLGQSFSYFVAAFKANRIMNNGVPLAAGVSVGPGASFNREDRMIEYCVCSGEDAHTGLWVGVQNEYMGYEFVINGSVHFGWARLSVTDEGVTKLTGYAYETVPRKAIVTGDTGSNDDDDSTSKASPAVTLPEPQPATLGSLALGTGGLSAWRREEEAIA